MNKATLVSIIIPAFNEGKVLRTLFISISKQSYPNIETILVDDSSTDKTSEVAKNFNVKFFRRKHSERSVQRNFGAAKARGKFLFFLDADMELSENVVSECVEKMKDESLGAVVIPEKSVATHYWEKVKAFERSFYNEKGDETTDAARFFSRKAFREVGGYDESITGPEDWDLPESVKAKGYKIGRVKSVIFHYERIPNLFSLVKKKYYYALKSHRYIRKQKIAVFSPKTIYFLRPVFYREWKKLLSHPLLTISMFVMFSFELIGAGTGYIQGKFFQK